MKKSLLVILSLILLLSGNIIPVFAEEEVPVITKMTPSDGAQEVSVVNLKAEVNFSTDMDMSTVSTASVSMTPAGIYKLVPAGARKVTIYFEKLELGTEYTLNFSKGIKSAAGAAMVPATKKFTTMQAAPQYHQITNGDMEDAEQLGVYGDGNQRRSIRFVKEENNTVLKFDVGWDEAPVLQKVYLESGKTYEMRARVKSSAAQNIWYCVNYRTASAPDTWYHTVGQINIEKDTWTDLSAAVSIPSESLTGSQDIRIVGKTKGTVLFIDDWQFYEQGYDLEPPSNTGYTAEKAAVKTMIGDGGKDEKRQLLVGLGIYESNEYAEDTQTVNRENFAKYIARLIGKGGLKMTEAAAVYQDIDVNTYEGYAGVMAAGDIIKPDPKGNFNPYGTVQYAEACRAFVVSLGYQYILEEFLPVEAAAQIGVIKGAAGNETMELTFAQLNTMLTNALKSEILIMDEIQNGAASFSKKETMEGMLSITEHTGLVTATDITGIDSTQHMESGYIQISGTAYAAPGIDAASLIGKRIRYYVDSSGDEEIVLYICDIDKLNTILTIDALDIISYSDNQYVYEEANGKTKTVRAAKDKSLIYNDKALSQYTPGHMLPAYGSVELIDNNRDGSYDVVNVKDYQTFVVGAVDKINGIIYDKFENKQIDVDLNGELRVLSGAAAAKFDGITENDILTIAQSADKTRAVIYKSNAVITGTVSRVKNDDKKRSVVFCDEVHGEIEREVNCVPGYAGADVLETGDTGIFYLDTFSNVAAFKKTAGNWQFGYFIKAIITDDEEHVEIKLLTANDKLERIVCASRLRVDEELCNTAEKAYHALAADAQLIQYKMNAAGEINRVVTVKNAEPDGLRVIANGSALEYRPDSGSLGNKIYIDSATQVFVVPADAKNAELYEYKYEYAKSYFISGKNYTFTAYSANENENTAEVILIKNRPVKDVDSVFTGVVSEISVGISEEDEIVTRVTCLSAARTASIEVDDSINLEALNAENGESGLKLAVGDVICWKQRNDGKPSDMKILFKGNGKQLKTAANPNTETLATAYRTFCGKIKNKEGSLLRLEDGEGTYEIYNMQMYNKIYMYDSSRGKVRQITQEELSAHSSADVLVVSLWRAHSLMVAFQ